MNGLCCGDVMIGEGEGEGDEDGVYSISTYIT